MVTFRLMKRPLRFGKAYGHGYSLEVCLNIFSPLKPNLPKISHHHWLQLNTSHSCFNVKATMSTMITWLRSEQQAKEMDCRCSLICNNWSGFHCRKKGAALFLHTKHAAVAHQPTELSSECVVRIALLTLSSCSHFCFESVFLYTVDVSVLTVTCWKEHHNAL